MQNQEVQSYEKLVFMLFLTITAGGFDAYTYLVHGKVFAGMQSGNLILLGASLGEEKFNNTYKYIIPLIFFMLGIVFTKLLQNHYQKLVTKKHQTQITVLILEMILLFITAFIPFNYPNLIFNMIISFVAAMQYQEFKRVHGFPAASIMMTGNIRTLTEEIYENISHKTKLKNSKK